MTKAAIFFVLWFAVTSAFGQSAEERRTINTLSAKLPFSSMWKLPEELTTSRLANLLQKFVNQVEGVGLRYVGDEHDADHGHVLFTLASASETPYLQPFAILYHTQEDAYKAYWQQSIPAQYAFLDVRNRNWIQWLAAEYESDGSEIQNARAYADPDKVDLAAFFGSNDPIEGEHYTIHSHKLSPSKLGFILAGELQFRFLATHCEEPVEITPYMRGPIRVSLLNGEPVCLVLKSDSPFLPSWWVDS